MSDKKILKRVAKDTIKKIKNEDTKIAFKKLVKTTLDKKE